MAIEEKDRKPGPADLLKAILARGPMLSFFDALSGNRRDLADPGEWHSSAKTALRPDFSNDPELGRAFKVFWYDPADPYAWRYLLSDLAICVAAIEENSTISMADAPTQSGTEWLASNLKGENVPALGSEAWVVLFRKAINEMIDRFGYARGKQPRVIKWLVGEFNGDAVPSPGLRPRKKLIKAALAENPDFGGSLDEATMKDAIEIYNLMVENFKLGNRLYELNVSRKRSDLESDPK